MIWPITSQTINRSQLLHPSEYIMAKFHTIPHALTPLSASYGELCCTLLCFRPYAK